MTDQSRGALLPPADWIKIAKGDVGEYAIHPRDFEVSSLEQYGAQPHRAVALVEHGEPVSFIRYLDRHSIPHQTQVYSMPRREKVVAIIDDHPPQDARGAFRRHVAQYTAKIDPTFAAWVAAIKAGVIPQRDFLEFLEEHAADVIKPGAADIMDLVLNFDVGRKIAFRSAVRLADGTRQIEYVEEDEQRGAIKAPEKITIRCPIYEGFSERDIQVRFRYRIKDGTLGFQLKIDRLDKLLRDEFALVDEAISQQLPEHVPIFRGVLNRE